MYSHPTYLCSKFKHEFMFISQLRLDSNANFKFILSVYRYLSLLSQIFQVRKLKKPANILGCPSKLSSFARSKFFPTWNIVKPMLAELKSNYLCFIWECLYENLQNKGLWTDFNSYVVLDVHIFVFLTLKTLHLLVNYVYFLIVHFLARKFCVMCL